MSIDIHNKEDKTYIVLGAPHSATSFVAKLLKDAGIKIGTNMRHYYQSSAFTTLNDKILRLAGGRWNQPPTQKALSKVNLDKEIKELINQRKDKFWGAKDPRFSLTLTKYLPHLDGDVYMICCFRKPEKVLRSFDVHRGKLGKKAIDDYNRSIIRLIKEFCELK